MSTDAITWMQDDQPRYDDDLAVRVRRVMRLATKGKSPSAKIIAGAINEVYETTARELLESTTDKAQALGMLAGEQEDQAATFLRLQACEAVLRTEGGTKS